MGRGQWKAAVPALPASIRAQTREEEKMKEDHRRKRPYVRRFKRKAFRRMILKVAVLLLLMVMLTILLFFATELKGNLKVNKDNAGSIQPDGIVDEPKGPDTNQPSMEKEWKEQLPLPEIERPISRSDDGA